MKPYTAYLDWIHSQQSILKERTIRWAQINSHSDHLNGLNQILLLLKQEFSRLGGTLVIHSLPPRQMVDRQGQIISIPLGKALSIRKREKAPIQVFLGGHMDTVYSPSHPFQQVELIQSDRLRGPGVTDMKGGLAILLTTLEALERSPYADQIGWEVLINPDEEVGSPGSTPLFIEASKRNHVGLIFEPSFADGTFVSHRKGSANFTIIVRGQAAHAGRDFYAGQSAIYAIARLIQSIESLNDPQKGITINVGHIEGGSALNIVPDLALCRLNIRALEQKDLEQVIAQLQTIVNENQGPTSCKMISESCRSPKPLNPATQTLLQSYQICSQELDLPFKTIASGGVTDGNTLSAHGLPTMDSLGAIGGNIHTSEEFLILPSLVERARLTTLFLYKLATKEIEIYHEPIYS